MKSRPTHVSASICSLYYISTVTEKALRKTRLSTVTEHEKVKGEAGRVVILWMQKNIEFRFHWAVVIDEVNCGARTRIHPDKSSAMIRLAFELLPGLIRGKTQWGEACLLYFREELAFLFRVFFFLMFKVKQYEKRCNYLNQIYNVKKIKVVSKRFTQWLS